MLISRTVWRLVTVAVINRPQLQPRHMHTTRTRPQPHHTFREQDLDSTFPQHFFIPVRKPWKQHTTPTVNRDLKTSRSHSQQVSARIVILCVTDTHTYSTHLA